MEYIKVPTTKGTVIEPVYTVEDFPYEIMENLPLVSKKQGKNKKLEYYNISAAFDIESTTIEPAKDSKCKYITRPYAFMYQWQFCICDKVLFGRRWEEFTSLLYYLRSKLELGIYTDDKGNEVERRLVVFVHNLSYEFQFMKDFLQIDSIFATENRKLIKFVSEFIEFRCSYRLSNRSLASFCENSNGCTYYKLVDQYDYRKLRTPDTVLTLEEKQYCYLDVRGLCQCIDAKLEEDDMTTLPLTSTGYVRRDYRNAMQKNKENRKQFLDIKLNEREYKMLKRAFRGGNTHANRFYSNTIQNNVYSFDISSSYPFKMMTGYFPVTKFTRVTLDTKAKLDYYTKKYCVVMDVAFRGVDLKENQVIPYIDIAHCTKKSNIVNDNGRVLHADYIEMTLTEIDLDIIRRSYHIDGFIVKNAMYSERGSLPKEFREMMLSLYDDKTKLKDVEGREYDYAKSKNILNGSFGMLVTAIDHEEITYDSESMEWDSTTPDMQPALDDFYNSRNSFLSYQWGVYVTANARKHLQDMLDIVGMDVLYIDTDSIKFIGEEHIAEFEQKNKEIIELVEKNDIRAYSDREITTEEEKENCPPECLKYIDGKYYHRFYLGTWDNDGNYQQFKTLGAKKYAYTKKKKGKTVFEVTVSGMGKESGAKAIEKMSEKNGTSPLEEFSIGNEFHDVGRTISWFNDEKPHEIAVNGCTFTTASNIGITDTTYTLGVTREYWDIIKDN